MRISMTIAVRIARSTRFWLLSLAACALIQCFPAAVGAAPADRADRAPVQIWFVRHAESEINVATIPHPIADAGVSYPLTERGVKQAIEFARTHRSTPITAIYTSTLLRAIQTSDALAFTHGLALRLAPEAVEIDLGLTPDAPQLGEVYRELRHKWLVEQDIEARHGSGESLRDAQQRFVPFVRELMNRHAHDDGVVIVMAHGATLGFLVPMLASNIPSDFALRHPLTNTGVIKTELRDKSLVCTEWLGIPSSDFDRKDP
jgi:2,3-bisphosphoglycerate-dependent phosphoglycerate mutase